MLTDKFGLYPSVCIEQVGYCDTRLIQGLSKATIPAISPRFRLNSLFSLVFLPSRPEISHCLAVFRHPIVGD